MNNLWSEFSFYTEDYIEYSCKFLEKHVSKMFQEGKQYDTNLCVQELENEICTISKEKLVFLLCHSGYIPELYLNDSSEETLYSKMVEALIMIWAKRIGFTKSNLPKQKSSKEDVTILDEYNHLIVCDAKSFRLGRSQSAPNVKDVLKENDINKWLKNHQDILSLGGLVVFPSQHDWKKYSEVYQYASNKNSPIVCLNYEHLAFLLLIDGYNGFCSKSKLINLINSYPSLFPSVLDKKKQNNKEIYYSRVEKFLFCGYLYDGWILFKELAYKIIKSKVFISKRDLENHINDITHNIQKKYENIDTLDIESLKQRIISLDIELETKDYKSKLKNIIEFRAKSNSIEKIKNE